jgi:microcystin-dependent protein
MKKIILMIFVLIALTVPGKPQGVAVTTDGSLPAASAMLDVRSTSRGILVPRMTAAQRAAISTPVQGLMVYQTDQVSGFYCYSGSAWREEMDVVNSAGSVLSGKLMTFDGTNWVAKSMTSGTTGTNQGVNSMQPYLTLDYYIATDGVFPSQSGWDSYCGEVQIGGFSFAPNWFVKCDGQLLDINNYTTLFTLIGTTYGGDGQNTFAVPDLRGRVALHQGQAPGSTYKVIGEQWGCETMCGYPECWRAEINGWWHNMERYRNKLFIV